jgi:hypothetical protein
MKWFYRVSYPLIIGHAPVPEYTVPRPVYEEVIFEQQWARHPADPYQIIDKSEPEWRMQLRFLMWFQIHSFSAFWRASGPIIPCLRVPAPRRRNWSPREQYGLIL